MLRRSRYRVRAWFMGLRDWRSRELASLRVERRAGIERASTARGHGQSELDTRREARKKARRTAARDEWFALVMELYEPVRTALAHPLIADRLARPFDVLHVIPSIAHVCHGDDDEISRHLQAIAYCLKVLCSRGIAEAIAVDRDGRRRWRYRLATCSIEVTDGTTRRAGSARAT